MASERSELDDGLDRGLAGALDPVRTHVRIAASLDPVDTVLWFRGTVHSQEPHQVHRHLFDIEGYRITRAVRVAGGWDLVSRVAAVHLHPGTFDRVDRFEDPRGAVHDVLHVWNDPVTERIGDDRGAGAQVLVMGDQVHVATDGLFLRANPLPSERWPRESGGEWLQGADLGRLVSSLADVRGPAASVPCALSFVRVGPWLPWMAMGDRPGQLVHHLGGVKLSGWAALPARLRAIVEAERPEFAFAPGPTAPDEPDESTWTRYSALRRPMPRQ